MSTLYVDNLQPNLGSQVEIPNLKPLGGAVVQSVVWEIPAIARSTAGSWTVTTTPTIDNTYSVAEYTFTKKHSDSHVACIASGHVDMNNAGSGGSPSIVALFEDGSDTLIGSGHRHIRHNNDEPFVYAFSGVDTSSGTSKTYKLRCHSSGGPMHFSRQNSADNGHSKYTVVLMEIAQ